MWNGNPFSGTKIALLCEGQVVTYLRDNKPEIPFPAMWDLPGGGREGNETPIECGLREVEEEFGLALAVADVIFAECHQSVDGGLDTYFYAMKVGTADLGRISFGNEGQHWQMMDVQEFISHPRAVPQLRQRLRALDEAGFCT